MISMRDKNEYFDEHFVLFGRVIHGFEIFEAVQLLKRDGEKPTVPVVVIDSGELRLGEKLSAEKGQLSFLDNYERNVFADEEEHERRRAEKKRLKEQK